ncbi:MAG TPA: hypothetical protein PLU91_12160 [Verrucomicrobiota bacterium]|nr:hypothetical protein [Verrucomicrobiota bacterium]
MKVFVRNTQSGWFYQGPSQWTPRQEMALDLGQVARAVERIFEAHLDNVEILLSYDEPRYDLVLPVPASPSRTEAFIPADPSRQELRREAEKAAHRQKKAHPR